MGQKPTCEIKEDMFFYKTQLSTRRFVYNSVAVYIVLCKIHNWLPLAFHIFKGPVALSEGPSDVVVYARGITFCGLKCQVGSSDGGNLVFQNLEKINSHFWMSLLDAFSRRQT